LSTRPPAASIACPTAAKKLLRIWTPDVDEQHRRLAIDAGRLEAARRRRRDETRRGSQQQRDHQGAVRSNLAGEPHIRRRVDASQQTLFGLAGLGQRFAALDDPHPAGGASRLAAADG
jgi:hypothetical protein